MMKKLSELGISPTPWKVDYSDDIDRVVNILDANNKTIVETDYDVYPPELTDARMMTAAPELYKWLAFAVEYYKCETRSCDKCPNGKCWIVDATAALAKAAGEEVGDGK